MAPITKILILKEQFTWQRIATICTSRTSSATFGRLLVSVTRTLYGWPTTASNPVNGVCLTALMLMALQNASTGQKRENA